jgi:hypothetical protein
MVIREPDTGFLLRTHRPNNKQICLCGCKFTACYVNIKVGWALLAGLRLMLHIFFNRQAVGNAAGKRHFIGILQFTAKCNTAGNGGDLNRAAL